MTPAQRHEFIVTANVNDGDWDLEKLVKQYEIDLLSSYGMDDVLAKIPGHTFDEIEGLWTPAPEKTTDKQTEKTEEIV